MTMTPTHLLNDDISEIALSLNSDVYGAHGDLSDEQIFDRLMKAIAVRAMSGEMYTPFGGSEIQMLPLREAARLIFSVWAHMDRAANEQLVDAYREYQPLPENPVGGQ
jgi:hypothetical protein